MDIMLLLKLSVLITCLSQAITDPNITVTREQCGRTVNLEADDSLVLDYDGGDLGLESGEQCMIIVENRNIDKIMCILTNSTRSRHCSSVFSFHIGNTIPGHRTIGYNCHDFYMQPLCARITTIYAVFKQSADYRKARVAVEIYLENMTYLTTTTASSLLTESETRNIIIGLTVGGVSILILLAVCKLCNRRTTNDLQEQRISMQSQERNQQSSQQVVSTVSQSYTSTPNGFQENINQNLTQNGYHVHQVISTSDPGFRNSQTGQYEQNSAYKQSGPVDLSDPPPPYPGY